MAITVSSGVTSTGIILSNDDMFILDGGTADRTIVNDNGYMTVASGGAADRTTMNGNSHMLVKSGGTADSTIVNDNGYMTVASGGAADRTTMNDNSHMLVKSGGTADHTVLNSGSLDVFGGTADDTTVNEGGLLQVSDSGTANRTIVNDNGKIYVSGGGTANSTTVNELGYLAVFSDGTANDTTVNDGGKLWLRGAAKNTRVAAGGKLHMEGGSHYGLLTVDDNAEVLAYGAVIDFSLAGRTAADDCLINDLGLISGSPSYTVTVHPAQSGTYRLANGAADFNETVTVKDCFDQEFGSLALGDVLNAGLLGYRLVLSGDLLSLAVTLSSGIAVYDGEWRSSGTFVNGITVDGITRMQVGSGGAANNTTVRHGGQLYVYQNGTANSTTINRDGYLFVCGGSAVCASVDNSGGMFVSDGGTANNTAVNSGGSMFVSGGGTADNTTVYDNGYMYVSSGGTARSTTLSGGWSPDPSSGINAHMNICDGGTASDTTVSSGGWLQVSGGGTADGVTVNSSGSMSVSSGGTATAIVAENGAFLEITVAPETYIRWTSDGSAFEMKDAFLSGYAMNSGGWLRVSGGGTADRTTVESGQLHVYEDGTANNTAVRGYGSMFVSGGGTAGSTMVDNGQLYVYEDGTANDTTVIYYGSMFVSSGGTANNTTMNHYGNMFVSSGGTANRTAVGVDDNYGYIDSCHMNIYDGGTANDTEVNNHGSMFVSSGGTANFTIVNNAGHLTVENGGTANNTAVNQYGYMFVSSGGTASIAFNPWQGGTVDSAAGATVTYLERDARVYCGTSSAGLFAKFDSLSDFSLSSGTSAIIYSGGTANDTAVNDSGSMFVSEGGTANSTTVNKYGSMFVSSGGTANSTTVNNYGNMFVSSGGTASSTIVNSGGSLTLAAGSAYGTVVHSGGLLRIMTAVGDAKLGGDQIFGGRVIITPPTQSDSVDMQGCNITFAVNERTPEDTVIINTLSWFSNVSYSIQVADDQALGVYKIATKAGDFTGTVSVGNGAEVYGSVTVNGDALSYGGNEYTLLQTDEILTFRIADVTPPDAPTAGADITTATNQNVTVTAAFSDDSAQKQYSLDGETWLDYTAGIVLEANGFIYFRAIDAAGNISEVTEYEVANIDKVAPTAPVATADATELTNQDVTVTAVFDDDSARKQYSLDGETWLDYTAGIVLEANGFIYFRAIDAAGNISEVTEYEVANIDKTAPEAPVAGADITTATNGNVTVTAVFDDNSARKQYSLDGENWSAYTTGVVMSANGTVCFRGIDEAGNISEVTSYTVENIDKNAPAKPVAEADITSETGKDVTVTAVFDDDSITKEYSLDGETWLDYTAGIVFAANGTVYFRGIDEAGNISEVAEYVVANISPTAVVPDKPMGGDLGRDANYEDSYQLELDYAGKYTLSGDFGRLNGSVALMQDKKTVASGAIRNGVLTFNSGKAVLLDAANSYTLVVKNSDKGKTASDYTFTLEAATLYPRGDKGANDWSDMKTAGADSAEIGAVGAVNAASDVLIADDGLSGWVGFGDAKDYLAFTLDSAASLALDLTTTDAAKFTVYSLVETTTRGVKSCSLKSLQANTLTAPKGDAPTAATTKNLLLSAGTYYLGVESTNAARGGNAAYTVALNNKSVFFTKGDNTDDWTDLKATGSAGAVGAIGTIDATSDVLVSNGWVGYGDAKDYLAFTLNSAALLSLDLTSTDAAKFTVYSLVSTTVRGVTTYSLKSLQTATLAAPKGDAPTVLTTKNLLLTAGTYYLGVESTNAAKGGNAAYTVTLNNDKSVFFTKGDNSDDWTNLKTVGNQAGAELGMIGEVGTASNVLVSDGWVGYGDAADYLSISLGSAASLALDFTATDAAKFTLYSLVSTTVRGVTTYSLKSLQTNALAAPKGDAPTALTTKNLLLSAGTYYLGVESTNAARGGNAAYTVALNNDKSVFYTKGDNSDDAWAGAQDFGVISSNEDDETGPAEGWVGFGDTVDFKSFSVAEDMKIAFNVSATDAVKFTVYQMVNGKLKSLQSTSFKADVSGTTKALALKADGEYYFAVESTNAARGGNADYTVSAGKYVNPLNETVKGAQIYGEGDPIDGKTGTSGADKITLTGNTHGSIGTVALKNGNDQIVFTQSAQKGTFTIGEIDMGAGDDQISVYAHSHLRGNTVRFGAGNDRLIVADHGNFEADEIAFGAGNDLLQIGKEADFRFADRVDFGDGDDTLAIDKGSVLVLAGCDGNNDSRVVDFGAGTDSLILNGTLMFDPAKTALSGLENVSGSGKVLLCGPSGTATAEDFKRFTDAGIEIINVQQQDIISAKDCTFTDRKTERADDTMKTAAAVKVSKDSAYAYKDFWLCGQELADDSLFGFADPVDYIKFTMNSKWTQLDCGTAVNFELLDSKGAVLAVTGDLCSGTLDLTALALVNKATYYIKLSVDDDQYASGTITLSSTFC